MQKDKEEMKKKSKATNKQFEQESIEMGYGST